jgi:hypothetical protein
VSAIGRIILGTIMAFRIRFWLELASLGMRMGGPRFVHHAIGRASLIRDDFLRLGFEDEPIVAVDRQVGATLPAPPGAYSVIEAGTAGFQVIEARSNGEPRVLAAFTTRAAAVEWLADRLGNGRRPPGDNENSRDWPV